MPGGGLCAIILPAIFKEAFVLKLNPVHTVAFSGVAMFGAFFIDFTNAPIITVFLNIFK